MNMKSYNLIRRTMLQFFACTVAIFLLMTPVFYLLTKYFYAEDVMALLQAIERHERLPDVDLEEDIIVSISAHFSLTFIVLFIAFLIMVHFVTKRLWQPFDDSLAKAERFNVAESKMPHFEASNVTEFNRLNDSLVRLMIKSRKSYRIMKEFAENASHELQTPLAVTRSKLDLLLQEQLTPQQLELVADMYQINSRMEHLNRNLLLLAKIDGLQYEERKTIDLEEFVRGLMPAYSLLRADEKIEFAPAGSSDMTVSANPTLLESLINNLVVNAIRNTPAGEVAIATSAGPKLSVSNTATNGPLDPAKIFSRFRTTGNGGTGLGLPIAKAICEYHGWQLDYSYAAGRHVFTITMSAAK